MSKHYTFFVRGVEYKSLRDAEEAVLDELASEYNNEDYENEYQEAFMDECDMAIDIYDENDKAISYLDYIKDN